MLATPLIPHTQYSKGAFEEHQHLFSLLPSPPTTVQVRTPSDLAPCSALVLPGGESTSMSLVGSSNGIFPALRDFVSSGKPVWGTCAGLILLCSRAVSTSPNITEGQALVGGLDATVCRNFFGSQVSSFEMGVPMKRTGNRNEEDFPGVFIRAPGEIVWGLRKGGKRGVVFRRREGAVVFKLSGRPRRNVQKAGWGRLFLPF